MQIRWLAPGIAFLLVPSVALASDPTGFVSALWIVIVMIPLVGVNALITFLAATFGWYLHKWLVVLQVSVASVCILFGIALAVFDARSAKDSLISIALTVLPLIPFVYFPLKLRPLQVEATYKFAKKLKDYA